jgi:outer membrane lipoprotein carrier protein
MTTFEAHFEQALLDAGGEVIDRSSGTLEIQRPGRFRWAYNEPYEQWLVADGLNMWSYDVDLAQVTVKPQAEALADTPALLLSGAEDAAEQFVYDGTYAEGPVRWVKLRPKNTASGFEKVELGFSNERLFRMVFLDNLEQTTLIELQDVIVNEPIDTARFIFEPPEDVDVVGIPVASITDP